MRLLGRAPEDLKRALAEGRITTAVYGMGRVGSPIAVAWLRAGAKVIGVDINTDLVDGLNRGIIPFDDEPGIEEGIRKALVEGRFSATADGVDGSRRSDVKIVVIPTTLNADKRLDNRNMESVIRSIGKGLKPGDVVIIECTVPPLTTEVLAKTILEEESGLRAEKDFGLAYSPERIYEGRALQDIEVNYPKVVGGVGPRSTDTVAALYEGIAKKGVIKLASAREAEASKIFEGVYRDANIALANEFAKLCDALGIDFVEARRAANSQPFCHLHMPSIGVGGLCIPVYPYFLMDVAERAGLKLEITRRARETNEGMAAYTFRLLKKILREAGIGVKNAKVGVLGLTFRGDVKDTRLSPATEFIKLLKGKVAGVKAYDPLIKSMNGVETCESLKELIEWADALVVATDHREFKSLDLRWCRKRLVVVDGKNVLDPARLPEGSLHVGIGRPGI
jgi:nucleotide sugar dehydrogenase